MDVPFETRERQAVLRLLSAAAFLIFFQSYIVAPLIPALVREFNATQNRVGLLVPAYLLPYGLSTLFYGPLSDRLGRRKILLVLLLAMVLTTAGTASSQNINQLLLWRALAGISTGGVIPITLALIADLFLYEQRGRALGWIFGAIAGGMAFGSTFGALLNPYLGWRVVFLIIAFFQLVNFLIALRHRTLLEGTRSAHPLTFAATMKSYAALLAIPRGFKTYGYIFFNGMFHSGVFAWLGSYLFARYRLSDPGIGIALLGYGIPGLLLGPAIGRAADRFGRRAIIPTGLLLSALSAALLILPIPLWLAACVCTLLSLGLDMSHPLLAGIITTLDPARRGQAMGLNAFILFTGFGLGSLAFQSLLTGDNFTPPLATFSTILFLLGLLAIPLFRAEVPPQK